MHFGRVTKLTETTSRAARRGGSWNKKTGVIAKANHKTLLFLTWSPACAWSSNGVASMTVRSSMIRGTAMDRSTAGSPSASSSEDDFDAPCRFPLPNLPRGLFLFLRLELGLILPTPPGAGPRAGLPVPCQPDSSSSTALLSRFERRTGLFTASLVLPRASPGLFIGLS